MNLRLLSRAPGFDLGCLCFLLLCLLQGPARGQAEQILAASGFAGGLVVHAGCEDGELLLSMAGTPHVLAQALVQDRPRLEPIRGRIQEEGLYGRVSAIAWEGPSLPYADGMVNLLLVSGGLTKVLPQDEIERVLAPGGVALTLGSGFSVQDTFRKPWPKDADDWTHARYDATGNAVSQDGGAGPPRFLQWEATPRWNRGVKTSSLVSAKGRLFYILDDSHFSARLPTWSLIARDASNGVQLWRHELSGWVGAQGGKKVGPAQANRRLIASGDAVYATLADQAPVSVLDAKTGEVLRTLDATGPAEEFLLSGGVLVTLVNPNTAAGIRRGQGKPMRLVAVEPGSGDLLWEHPAAMILPLTLAADGTQVVFHDGRSVKSLDLRSGTLRWTSPPTGQKIVFRDKSDADSPGAEKSTIVLAPQFAPTLILYGEVVAFAGGRQLNVFSATDGRELWRTDYAPSNYSAPVDLFGFNGSLWGPNPDMNLWRPLDDDLGYQAYDPVTGAIRKQVAGKYGFRFQHHRCHQMKVVGNTVIGARAGIEFLDTDTGDVAAQHWIRGSCFYGVLPANGRLYVPPHDCACYVRAKLSGFLALNTRPPSHPVLIPGERRLQRGPAYGDASLRSPGADSASPADWPTYRHDPARSGRTAIRVGTELLLGWQRPLGGNLTSPVVAEGRLLVASTNAHELQALDAATGEPLWRYRFDARVDSPPTVHEGLVLCGCRDGSVHALRAADGALVWRFLAGPEERHIVCRGQLESVWPVHGSVLVLNGTAYFAAGKSSYLDGGIRLYGLEAHTGRKIVDRAVSTLGPDGCEWLDDQGVDGCLSDILSSDGQRLFMRHASFDLEGNLKAERLPHLHCPDGFLSSDTTNRLPWTYAPLFTSPHQGAFFDLRLSRFLFPTGRILVEDDDTIYGFGQNHYGKASTDSGGQWALFAAAKESGVPLDLTAKDLRALALSGKQSVSYRWWKPLPIQTWAMVRTEDVLFVAGHRGGPLLPAEALEGKTEGALLAVAPGDGRVLAEMSLPSMPVWDGMAVAQGNIYLALADGQVVCLWPVESGRPGATLSAASWRAALPPVELAEEPGLVGRWRFDEGAGMLARDCSGNGQDAAVSGAWSKDEGNACLAVDAEPRAAVIPDAPHLHFGNEDFTLALWIKPGGHGVRLLGKEAFPDNWWVINLLKDGRAELVLGEGRGPSRSVRAATESPLSIGAWRHLAAVVDRQGKEVRWYLDGKFDGRQAIPATMTAGLHGGGSGISIPSNHQPFRGMLRDFRIYRKALDEAVLDALIREGAARPAGASSRS